MPAPIATSTTPANRSPASSRTSTTAKGCTPLSTTDRPSSSRRTCRQAAHPACRRLLSYTASCGHERALSPSPDPTPGLAQVGPQATSRARRSACAVGALRGARGSLLWTTWTSPQTSINIEPTQPVPRFSCRSDGVRFNRLMRRRNWCLTLKAPQPPVKVGMTPRQSSGHTFVGSVSKTHWQWAEDSDRGLREEEVRHRIFLARQFQRPRVRPKSESRDKDGLRPSRLLRNGRSMDNLTAGAPTLALPNPASYPLCLRHG